MYLHNVGTRRLMIEHWYAIGVGPSSFQRHMRSFRLLPMKIAQSVLPKRQYCISRMWKKRHYVLLLSELTTYNRGGREKNAKQDGYGGIWRVALHNPRKSVFQSMGFSRGETMVTDCTGAYIYTCPNKRSATSKSNCHGHNLMR